MERDYVLAFREPVTLSMLRSACALAGLSVDDLFDDQAGALAGLSLSMEQAQAFLDLVLVAPPTLAEMEALEAEALAAYVAADFFSDVLARRFRRQAETLRSSLTASAVRRRPAPQAAA